MSTRCSIADGPNFHAWVDCLDANRVLHLEVYAKPDPCPLPSDMAALEVEPDGDGHYVKLSSEVIDAICNRFAWSTPGLRELLTKAREAEESWPPRPRRRHCAALFVAIELRARVGAYWLRRIGAGIGSSAPPERQLDRKSMAGGPKAQPARVESKGL